MSPRNNDREFEQNKNAGKNIYSGRRRPMTRKSGFQSSPKSTGGEYCFADAIKSYEATTLLCITFRLPTPSKNKLVGFGLWYSAAKQAEVTWSQFSGKLQHKGYPSPNWSKLGAMWKSDGLVDSVEVRLSFPSKTKVHVYGAGVGTIRHKYYSDARPELLSNMYQFAPEALFYENAGGVLVSVREVQGTSGEWPELPLKCCNRCARFLPVNFSDERCTLSFSNHCVAEHRRPCRHNGFGKLTSVKDGSLRMLEYGFQLECRFCKKFEVNAALNPQRSPAQMKEDGARRRAFELLLTELFEGSSQLQYRHKHGGELTEHVFRKFGGKCFKCGVKLRSASEMNLDHTRPLALLWPLDETATALCGECNSQKRDRPPVEYYTDEEIVRLASITGIPLSELKDPGANEDAVRKLLERKEWFYRTFMHREDMVEERDGKITGELLLKALQKAINRCSRLKPFDLNSLRPR